ncbi:UV resistance [Labeo rohita]|uniref:UV resistance n=1 Tax=Labeo rohita TaxID=84645 RepID=A0A498LX19_LABRO|nr:UV resistance [Labeo rohita]
MGQDPNQSYNHKELAKITGSPSHTLIATLKLSDRHSAHLQQELTRAQRRISQLELEVQDRQEGSDEEDPSAKEIVRLRETLTTTSQEMEQAKERDFVCARPKQRNNRVDDNTHLDATGRNPGTIQGLKRVDGIGHGTRKSHQKAQEKLCGNLVETPRESDNHSLEQPAPETDERTPRDLTLTELKLNPHQNKRHDQVLTHKN